MRLFSREPAATLAVVQAVIALIVAFGFDLSAEQVGAIVAATAAVLGLATRQRVSPYVDDGHGVDL